MTAVVTEQGVEPIRQPVQAGVPEPERPIPWLTRARIAFVRGFLVAWMRCFSLKGLYLLGRAFGTCEYLCDYHRRRRVHAKLIEFFKQEATPAWRRRITWRYFMRIRCDKMFYTIMDRIPRAKLMNRIKVFNAEPVDAALARGHGAYVATSHFGSFHVAGLIMALLGYKLVGVRDPKESPIRRYIQQKYRDTFPEIAAMRLFYAGVFPRQLFRDFRDNYIVASSPDVERKREEHHELSPVTFFGEKREFMVGPIRIALRCKAPILQGFVVSRPNFYYRLVCAGMLLDPADVTDEDAAVASCLQAYADNVERHFREHPDHLMKI